MNEVRGGRAPGIRFQNRSKYIPVSCVGDVPVADAFENGYPALGLHFELFASLALVTGSLTAYLSIVCLIHLLEALAYLLLDTVRIQPDFRQQLRVLAVFNDLVR